MPAFNLNQSIPAGATVELLTDWNFQTPPSPGMIQLMMGSTAAGLFATLSSLNLTIFQDSPVNGTLAAGQIPSRLNTEPIVERVPGGQKLSLRVRNTTGGALPLLGTVDFAGAGGGGGGRRRAAPRRRR